MSDKPKRNVRSLKQMHEEISKSAQPHLDEGEEIRAQFMGCTRWSPLWPVILLPLTLVLLPVYFLAWLVGVIFPSASLLPQNRFILVTDRNVYCFSHWRGRQGVKDVLYKAPLGEVAAVRVGQGFPWSLTVNGWPRLYAAQIGFRGERAKVATLINQARQEAAGATQQERVALNR